MALEQNCEGLGREVTTSSSLLDNVKKQHEEMENKLLRLQQSVNKKVPHPTPVMHVNDMLICITYVIVCVFAIETPFALYFQ